MSEMNEEKPRTLTDFLRAVRREPGFVSRVLATMFFGAALVVTKGFATGLFTVGVGIALGIAVAYPHFRRACQNFCVRA
jgi:hypothetical protein